MSSRPKLLYILAPSYSGSTLLTLLLSQHDEIATIGELKATSMGIVEEYRCSCGERIRECGFWESLRERAARAGEAFSLADFGTVFRARNALVNKVVNASVRGSWFERLRAVFLGLVPERISGVAGTIRRNFVLSQVICELQGGRIFLDGSKDSARLLHFLRARFWDIRVIYLQRDGRGVANSFRRHEGLGYPDAVAYWRRTVRELRHMRARLDDAVVFDLRYEDLCRDPDAMLARIFRWLDLEPAPVGTARQSHILGNRMRLSGAAEIRVDEGWKQALSEGDFRVFRDMGADLNRQLGYE
jgi:hypothetical protein